jgi:hypothetical protein
VAELWHPTPCDRSKAPEKAGNQFGVSPSYRNYCQPATGTASANCRPGTRTTVSSIYRDRTHPEVGKPQPEMQLPPASGGSEPGIRPGQNGCAARDLNPEPAVKSLKT